MGAAVGAALRARGETVLWASAGRSGATLARAQDAGLEDTGEVGEVSRRSEIVISLCPPHAAVDVASSMPGFGGIYVDANAIAPATARKISGLVARYVDGGIIGMAPTAPGMTRLYLSGPEAQHVAEMFVGTVVETRVVSDDPAAASAVKLAYAAWTKGTSALLLAARALARAEGVEDHLIEEWRLSLSQLVDQSATAAGSAQAKGWRWVGEMEEIADAMATVGLPDGFHRAAAEIYRRAPRDGDSRVEHVLDELCAKSTSS